MMTHCCHGLQATYDTFGSSAAAAAASEAAAAAAERPSVIPGAGEQSSSSSLGQHTCFMYLELYDIYARQEAAE